MGRCAEGRHVAAQLVNNLCYLHGCSELQKSTARMFIEALFPMAEMKKGKRLAEKDLHESQ